jgi:hypothetical protein
LLFRLLICWSFGEIVTNLNKFIMHFNQIFGNKVSVLELERFAPHCTTDQLDAFKSYINKCFSS